MNNKVVSATCMCRCGRNVDGTFNYYACLMITRLDSSFEIETFSYPRSYWSMVKSNIDKFFKESYLEEDVKDVMINYVADSNGGFRFSKKTLDINPVICVPVRGKNKTNENNIRNCR